MNAMSAIGTKRTSRVAPHMSAVGGKADMPFCAAHVRFCPKADIRSSLNGLHLNRYDCSVLSRNGKEIWS